MEATAQPAEPLSYSVLSDLAAVLYVASPDAPKQHKQPLSNFSIEVGDDGESERRLPLPMRDIIVSLMDHTDGWPRRVAGCLFIHDSDGVHWLENASALFGWLAGRCGIIEWSNQTTGCVTKEELFQELCRTAESYSAVEELPHFPPLPGHYYACEDIPAGPDDALTQFIDAFAPATDDDRMLILAMFATPFWGAKAGSRPAFLITSDAGRGVGKSKITDMLSLLTGGHIELSAGEDAGRMRSRLLSPEGLKKRIARLDNVKTMKFSWAELESIITSPIISGHKLHHGESARPNSLTWIITLNGASLGTDMAQRVVTIKLDRPHRVGCWEEDVIRLIETRRPEIIAGLRSFLESEPQPMPEHSRWASWEDQVLSRLEDPWRIQKTIKERSDTANVDNRIIEQIEEVFRDHLLALGYQANEQIHVPLKISGAWINEATNAKREFDASNGTLRQYCVEGFAKNIYENPSHFKGRGFVYRFEQWIDSEIEYDLKERIEAEQKERFRQRGTDRTSGVPSNVPYKD